VKHSTDRILTTHVGSLPRPKDLIELYRKNAPDAVLLPRVKSAVAEVVKQQRDAGIDIVDDGEYAKAMRQDVDYGAWWFYIYDRLAGFSMKETVNGGPAAWTAGSKERKEFAQFYQEDGGMGSAGHGGTGATRARSLVGTGPVKYTGHERIRRDIENLKAAMASAGVTDAFMPAVSPATLQILPSEYYKTRDDYTWALAEAMHEEYKAITDAGLVLQIDDPALVDIYDWWFSLKGDHAGYRKWAEFQIEAVNHALKGIPEDRVRFHICWGSWHGPHASDIPLKDVVDLLVKVNAQAYSIEAGNVRHEHEWKVWRDTKLASGKILIPGVVSHATNVLEHPELVADRIVVYANLVGRENVIAGTDCGLGGRIHPQLAWAKLDALRQGADLATKQLWKS
jgi:5-methyltetrahydropteroyltriglutamate--homocysteine methyltransferase